MLVGGEAGKKKNEKNILNSLEEKYSVWKKIARRRTGKG